ncbi:hypothetical protein KZ436_08375, partial [Glaesserella parasuis]|nr:hypothetical protein [Glaesserella parasuis]
EGVKYTASPSYKATSANYASDSVFCVLLKRTDSDENSVFGSVGEKCEKNNAFNHFYFIF